LVDNVTHCPNPVEETNTASLLLLIPDFIALYHWIVCLNRPSPMRPRIFDVPEMGGP